MPVSGLTFATRGRLRRKKKLADTKSTSSLGEVGGVGKSEGSIIPDNRAEDVDGPDDPLDIVVVAAIFVPVVLVAAAAIVVAVKAAVTVIVVTVEAAVTTIIVTIETALVAVVIAIEPAVVPIVVIVIGKGGNSGGEHQNGEQGGGGFGKL